MIALVIVLPLALLLAVADARAGEVVDLWPVQVNGKWGYINHAGELIVPAEFDSAGEFRDTFAALVKRDGKWGCLDGVSCSLLVPVEFDFVHDPRSGYFVARYGGAWGVIGWNRRFVPVPEADSIAPAGQSCARFRRGNLWGYLDHSGRVIIPAKYVHAGDFQFMSHTVRDKFFLAPVQDGDQWGLITLKDSVAVPFRFDSVGHSSRGRLAVKVGGLWGYADSSGAVVILPVYDAVTDFGYDYFPAYGFGEAVAAVRQAGRWGYINAWNSPRVSLQYAGLGRVGMHRIAVCQDGKWGFMDCDERLVIPAVYDTVTEFHGNAAYVRSGNRWGIIDTTGAVVLEPSFDDVCLSGEPFVLVHRNGRCGFYNAHTRQERGWFDEARPFDRGLAYVKDQGVWKYIDTEGRVIWSQSAKAK
jgi:hypothetical protein